MPLSPLYAPAPTPANGPHSPAPDIWSLIHGRLAAPALAAMNGAQPLPPGASPSPPGQPVPAPPPPQIGLGQPTDAAPLGDMSAIDEAVRRFNETAAQTPLHMFAPGNFWDKQSAALALQRHQAGQDASQWINQQLGQRMPGGVPRSQEGRRLDMSADPRYGAQFPAAAPAPQVDQALVDRANELFGKVGAPKDVEGTDRVLYADELGRIPGVNEEKLTPAARAALRDRAIRSRLANDPDWVAWREAARAAGADATAKGLPSPDLQAPVIQGQIFQQELTPEQQAAKEMFDAARKERGEQRKQAILEAAQRRRAQAAINSLRDPQTRNAVLAAGLFGGEMPQNAALALGMMGYPDAAKLAAQIQIANINANNRGAANDVRQRELYIQSYTVAKAQIDEQYPNATPQEKKRLIQDQLRDWGISPPAPTGGAATAAGAVPPVADSDRSSGMDRLDRLRGIAKQTPNSLKWVSNNVNDLLALHDQNPALFIRLVDELPGGRKAFAKAIEPGIWESYFEFWPWQMDSPEYQAIEKRKAISRSLTDPNFAWPVP